MTGVLLDVLGTFGCLELFEFRITFCMPHSDFASEVIVACCRCYICRYVCCLGKSKCEMCATLFVCHVMLHMVVPTVSVTIACRSAVHV